MGFLMVPCLLYFYRFGVKAAFGTSLVVIAAVAVPGTLSHFALPHVNIALAILMIAGSIPDPGRQRHCIEAQGLVFASRIRHYYANNVGCPGDARVVAGYTVLRWEYSSCPR